jgi:predicted phosphodiesterase
MKIVFIADTHDKHRDVILPKGDVLVHAGDMVNVLNLVIMSIFFKMD